MIHISHPQPLPLHLPRNHSFRFSSEKPFPSTSLKNHESHCHSESNPFPSNMFEENPNDVAFPSATATSSRKYVQTFPSAILPPPTSSRKIRMTLPFQALQPQPHENTFKPFQLQ